MINECMTNVNYLGALNYNKYIKDASFGLTISEKEIFELLKNKIKFGPFINYE